MLPFVGSQNENRSDKFIRNVSHTFRFDAYSASSSSSVCLSLLLLPHFEIRGKFQQSITLII